jgi:hypothetical protein
MDISTQQSPLARLRHSHICKRRQNGAKESRALNLICRKRKRLARLSYQNQMLVDRILEVAERASPHVVKERHCIF